MTSYPGTGRGTGTELYGTHSLHTLMRFRENVTMGKAGKSRKRARREREIGSLLTVDHATSGSSKTGFADTVESSLDPIDVEITETTLRQLLDNPMTLLRSPEARLIRTQAYAIVEALGTGKSLIGRINDALHDNRWTDATELLRQCHNMPPPLGSLQRWIRDLFESSVSVTDPAIAYKVLYHILRCTGQEPRSIYDDSSGAICTPLQILPMWYSRTRRVHEDNDIRAETWVIPEVEALTIESAWREGMTLWSCNANVLNNESTNVAAITSRCNVPFVSGAFILNDVLTSNECDRILCVANKMGFTPEASYSLSDTTSQAADGVVWVVHDGLRNNLFDRVKSLLPTELCGGNLIHLNSRWRIYRYNAGTVYRPHIDGAWNGSGIVDGKYVSDIYDGNVTSRLTFLLYLNDDFEEGGTTFYSPSNKIDCVVAQSVAPIQGSVLCFPHGSGVEHVGLVHEGSAVTKGVKYVMRSDVLYMKVDLA